MKELVILFNDYMQHYPHMHLGFMDVTHLIRMLFILIVGYQKKCLYLLYKIISTLKVEHLVVKTN
jgi:hypothetical protein